jgi:hypothetical protein
VYHNPHATCPLERQVFRQPEEFQGMVTDLETGHWEFEVERMPLVFRRVETIRMVRDRPSEAAVKGRPGSKEARKKKRAERQRKKGNRR